MKYPGGYRIINIGHNPTSGMKVPGLYNEIVSSDKPVILTFSGSDPLDYKPKDYVNHHWMDVKYTADDIEYILCFGTMYTDIDGSGTPEVARGIMVSADDYVNFYEK